MICQLPIYQGFMSIEYISFLEYNLDFVFFQEFHKILFFHLPNV